MKMTSLREKLRKLMEDHSDEGEIIKARNGWFLTRENLEWRKHRKPKYSYNVYYVGEDGAFHSMGTFHYREALDHFNYQSRS